MPRIRAGNSSIRIAGASAPRSRGARCSTRHDRPTGTVVARVTTRRGIGSEPSARIAGRAVPWWCSWTRRGRVPAITQKLPAAAFAAIARLAFVTLVRARRRRVSPVSALARERNRRGAARTRHFQRASLSRRGAGIRRLGSDTRVLVLRRRTARELRRARERDDGQDERSPPGIGHAKA